MPPAGAAAARKRGGSSGSLFERMRRSASPKRQGGLFARFRGPSASACQAPSAVPSASALAAQSAGRLDPLLAEWFEHAQTCHQDGTAAAGEVTARKLHDAPAPSRYGASSRSLEPALEAWFSKRRAGAPAGAPAGTLAGAQACASSCAEVAAAGAASAAGSARGREKAAARSPRGVPLRAGPPAAPPALGPDDVAWWSASDDDGDDDGAGVPDPPSAGAATSGVDLGSAYGDLGAELLSERRSSKGSTVSVGASAKKSPNADLSAGAPAAERARPEDWPRPDDSPNDRSRSGARPEARSLGVGSGADRVGEETGGEETNWIDFAELQQAVKAEAARASGRSPPAPHSTDRHVTLASLSAALPLALPDAQPLPPRGVESGESFAAKQAAIVEEKAARRAAKERRRAERAARREAKEAARFEKDMRKAVRAAEAPARERARELLQQASVALGMNDTAAAAALAHEAVSTWASPITHLARASVLVRDGQNAAAAAALEHVEARSSATEPQRADAASRLCQLRAGVATPGPTSARPPHAQPLPPPAALPPPTGPGRPPPCAQPLAGASHAPAGWPPVGPAGPMAPGYAAGAAGYAAGACDGGGWPGQPAAAHAYLGAAGSPQAGYGGYGGYPGHAGAVSYSPGAGWCQPLPAHFSPQPQPPMGMVHAGCGWPHTPAAGTGAGAAPPAPPGVGAAGGGGASVARGAGCIAGTPPRNSNPMSPPPAYHQSLTC